MKSFRILCALSIVAAYLTGNVLAAKRSTNPLTKTPDRDHVAVEMFRAIENKEIAVDLIGIDSTKANVIIKNKTDKPLAIRLPEAFAGVPAHAQFMGAGMGMPGRRWR